MGRIEGRGRDDESEGEMEVEPLNENFRSETEIKRKTRESRSVATCGDCSNQEA